MTKKQVYKTIEKMREAAVVQVDMERGTLEGYTKNQISRSEIAKRIGYSPNTREVLKWLKEDLEYQGLLRAERLRRDIGKVKEFEDLLPGLKEVAEMLSEEAIARLCDPERRAKIPDSVLFNAIPRFNKFVAEVSGRLGDKGGEANLLMIRKSLMKLPPGKRELVYKKISETMVIPFTLEDILEGEVIEEGLPSRGTGDN
jgi:hypothetical protein